MFSAILRRLRIFFFGFYIAGTLLLVTSVFSEKSEPSLVKFWMQNRISLVLAQFPQLAPELSGSLDVQTQILSGAPVANPKATSSLDQLKQRQKQEAARVQVLDSEGDGFDLN